MSNAAAESESCCGEGVVHPCGEELAEEGIEREAGCYSNGRADERDARGDPEYMHARRAECEADTELRGALRDAVGDDAEDADESEREGHG